jgi:hypothetical protein
MNQKQQIDQYCRQYKITGMAAKIDQTVKTEKQTAELHGISNGTF